MNHKLQKLAIAVGDVVNLLRLKSELAISKKSLIEKSMLPGVRSWGKNSEKVAGGRCKVSSLQYQKHWAFITPHFIYK